VSVPLSGFQRYYEGEAETWEFMALTRARVAWASDSGFGTRVRAAIESALRRPRPGVRVAADVRSMRDLMERERRAHGFWDLKLIPGGLVDAEFVGQFRQLQAAAGKKPISVSTLDQLSADPSLRDSWALHQALSQLLACAFDDRGDPEGESATFRARLAEAAGERDFKSLQRRLERARKTARKAFERALPAPRDGSGRSPR
jgi:glutamate-ammonia-ligase adenylyltransferase